MQSIHIVEEKGSQRRGTATLECRETEGNGNKGKESRN